MSGVQQLLADSNGQVSSFASELAAMWPTLSGAGRNLKVGGAHKFYWSSHFCHYVYN